MFMNGFIRWGIILPHWCSDSLNSFYSLGEQSKDCLTVTIGYKWSVPLHKCLWLNPFGQLSLFRGSVFGSPYPRDSNRSHLGLFYIRALFKMSGKVRPTSLGRGFDIVLQKPFSCFRRVIRHVAMGDQVSFIRMYLLNLGLNLWY